MRALLILLYTALTGCGLNGTGTGNPALPASASEPAVSLFYFACMKISACNSTITAAECMSGILPLTTFAEKVGITVQPPPTVEEIENARAAGSLKADSGAEKTCTNDIGALDCTAPGLTSGYVAGAPNPYAGAADMMPASCTAVFPPH